MKTKIKLLLINTFLLILFNSCQNQGQGQINTQDTICLGDTSAVTEIEHDLALVDSVSALNLGLKLWPTGRYADIKQAVKKKRNDFFVTYQTANNAEKERIIEEASIYLSDILTNNIIPFWYGTVWDMSGYSNKPGEGTVGCSYFVSNTLVAAGFNLNRFRLAQTDPIATSKSLMFSDSVIQYQNSGNISDLSKTLLKNHPEGLYIIGLDIHIGYLLIYQSALYFIHSSYYPPNVVCREYFEKSPGINASSNFYIIPLSTNKMLIEKWIQNEFIFIQKPVYMQVDEKWWNKQR